MAGRTGIRSDSKKKKLCIALKNRKLWGTMMTYVLKRTTHIRKQCSVTDVHTSFIMATVTLYS